MKQRLFLGAVLALLGLATLAPAAAARPQQDVKKVKVGDVKLKDVDKKDGKLKNGKLKTGFGKAKMKNGKVRLKF